MHGHLDWYRKLICGQIFSQDRNSAAQSLKVFGIFTEHPSSVSRTHFGDFTISGLTNASSRESFCLAAPGTHMCMTNPHTDTHSYEFKKGLSICMEESYSINKDCLWHTHSQYYTKWGKSISIAYISNTYVSNKERDKGTHSPHSYLIKNFNLATEIRQEKEERLTNRNEEGQSSLSADGLIPDVVKIPLDNS